MLHRFSSPWLFVHQVSAHEQIKSKLKPMMLDYYNEHKDDQDYQWSNSPMINSHYHQDLTVFDSQMVNEIVWKPLDLMFDELKRTNTKYDDDELFYMPAKSHLIGMWWNIYPPDTWAPLHAHAGYDLSGAYFLELDEPNGLVFCPPVLDGYFPFSSTSYYTNKNTTEGDVVIFPAGLNHYVTPSKKLRMSISFNLLCDAPEDKVNPLMRLISNKYS